MTSVGANIAMVDKNIMFSVIKSLRTGEFLYIYQFLYISHVMFYFTVRNKCIFYSEFGFLSHKDS